MVVTLCAALTFGVLVSNSNFALAFFNGAISLNIACTLAIPFVCSKSHRPFWASYGTTAAYSMLIRGGDDDIFTPLLLLPLHLAGDDLTLSGSERPVLMFFLHVGQLWTPVLVGAISGVCFATAFRLSGRISEDG